MSGYYLYCQSPECGVYLGSLGANGCHLCGWVSGREEEDEDKGEPHAE